MIKHANIFYIECISEIGGVESFVYYMAKKYNMFDICVVCKSIKTKQFERLVKFCPVYVHRGEHIECELIITNYDTSILDYVDHPEAIMVVHADYSQPCYKKYPNFHHPKLTKIFGITPYICEMVRQKFGVECELCYNPFVKEKEEKRIVIVSATRLSNIKGGWRMKEVARRLDQKGINYIWYVFTNENDIIGSENVIFIRPRLDVYKWMMEADIIFQASDTEAMSYTINERKGLWMYTLRYTASVFREHWY